MFGFRTGGCMLLVLTLTACGSSTRLAPVDDLASPGQASTAPDARASVPQTSAPAYEARTRPLPETDTGAGSGGATAAPAPARQSANPAVVALLNDANQSSSTGQHDRAAASIERALGIEPRSAWLWHRLAVTRLQQGDLGQAAALAAKSNALAGDDRRLQSDNWRIIAEVHRQRGEHTAAKSAADKAAQLAVP